MHFVFLQWILDRKFLTVPLACSVQMYLKVPHPVQCPINPSFPNHHSPQNIPRIECCCCEQPIGKQQKFFTAIWLDAHNNNIRSVGYSVDYAHLCRSSSLAVARGRWRYSTWVFAICHSIKYLEVGPQAQLPPPYAEDISALLTFVLS